MGELDRVGDEIDYDLEKPALVTPNLVNLGHIFWVLDFQSNVDAVALN